MWNVIVVQYDDDQNEIKWNSLWGNPTQPTRQNKQKVRHLIPEFGLNSGEPLHPWSYVHGCRLGALHETLCYLGNQHVNKLIFSKEITNSGGDIQPRFRSFLSRVCHGTSWPRHTGL